MIGKETQSTASVLNEIGVGGLSVESSEARPQRRDLC